MNHQDSMPVLKASGSFTLLAVACLTIMVGCVIVPGLPGIAQHLGMADAAGWLVTTPSLGVVVFGLVVGRLIRALGPRRALCVGLFLYGALGVIGAWMNGPIAVLADRFLLGGATAVVMASGTGLISEFFDGKARLRMIARQGMAIELGGVIFLFIGGLLATISWRWPFALYPVAWLFLAMVLAFVPGVGTMREASPRAEEAMLPTRMTDVYLAACISMMVFFAGVILLPFRLAAAGLSESQIGMFLAFVSLVAVGAAAVMPSIVRLLGETKTIALAFLSYAIAHTIFLMVEPARGLIAGGVLLGCAFGLSIPLVNHLTVERSPVQRRGEYLGYLSVAIFLGQFLASFLDLLPNRGTGFGAAIMLSAVGMIAAIINPGRTVALRGESPVPIESEQGSSF